MFTALHYEQPLFLLDYEPCRAAFLAACSAVERYPSEARRWLLDPQPDVAGLSCDAAWFGARDVDTVVVLISGTHGVEGYCGSAIQRAVLTGLRTGSIKLPDRLALLFVHALNPWGMYWARRCDQDGIDLNRNFVDFSRALPAAGADYERVLACLENASPAARWPALNALIGEWGQAHFDTVFSGGQYQRAWAPFFGGNKVSFSRSCIEAVSAHWRLAERELIVLDLHTGLGPWAFGELISDHPADSRANQYARDKFGPAVAITAQGESFSVAKHGLMDYYWHTMMQERGCYLTLEFGSYGTQALFDVLIKEHLFWRSAHAEDLEEPSYAAIRADMLRHFCPDDSLWQEAALFKTWQVLERILS